MVSTTATSVRLQRVEEEKHAVMESALSARPRRPSMVRPTDAVEAVEEKTRPHPSAVVPTRTTVLRADEIADLRRYHDSSLAASTRRAYHSDYDGFVAFLPERFPPLSIQHMQQQCTLEHVLAYLNHLCCAC